MIRLMGASAAVLLLAACGKSPTTNEVSIAGDGATAASDYTGDVYASTYQRIVSAPVLLVGATVLVGNGERLEEADVLLQDGRIAGVGVDLPVPEGTQRVSAHGKWVTPGLIDVHSHLGVASSPGVQAHADHNESTGPVTSQVWAEHSVFPQDPGFAAALAGGVTTLQILPGSVNLIGGRGVTLKNMSATTVQGMKFPGAPHGVKMACGENPRRYYGERGGPKTRMGSMAGYRSAFLEAQDYAKRRAGAEPGKRDLRLDTLAGVLSGDLRVHLHCYRADDMAMMMDLAKEFGFRIAAFHHGVEAYKIADQLAESGTCAAMWADWWGFKMEAWDGIQENVALVDRADNGCALIHSDSPEGIQRLNQEAAKVMGVAQRMGWEIAPERAIQWLTQHPASSLGISDQTGTLQVGRMADVVLWSGNPFSVYAKAEQVWIDGAHVYDRNDPRRQPRSDLLLGQAPDAGIGTDLLVRNATVYTAGPQGTLDNADVLVRAGRIVAIGRNLQAEDVETVDAGGLPLTPALFGGISGIGVEEITHEPSTNDASLALGDGGRGLMLRPEFDVTQAYNPDSALVPVATIEGFGFSLLAPNSTAGGSILAGQGAIMRLDGSSQPAGPRVLVMSLGAASASLTGSSRAGQWLLLDQLVDEVRGRVAPDSRAALLAPAGRDALKHYLGGGGRIVVQVDRAADIRQLLQWSSKHKVRIAIAGGAEAWQLADELARDKVPVFVDPLVNLPSSFDQLGATLENAARLHRHGVEVGFATAGLPTHNTRKLRQMAGNAVANGLPWDMGLAGLTRVPAEAFGVGDTMGTISVGKSADMVLWSGDPLDVVNTARQIWLSGKAVRMQSRQTELRDRYKGAVPAAAAGQLPVAYPREVE